MIQVGLKPNKKCPSKRWCCQHVLHLGGLCQRRCCDHAASDFREGRGALRTFGMQTIDSIDHAKWQNPQNSFCLQDLFFAHVQVSKQTIKGNVQIEASAFENGKKGYGFDTPGPLDISSTNGVIISLQSVFSLREESRNKAQTSWELRSFRDKPSMVAFHSRLKL